MLIGYARVSTIEQTLDLQQDALRQAGCEQVFTDHISGAKSERPGLTQALEFVRSGDILVVWKLDRLDAPSSSSSRLLLNSRSATSDFAASPKTSTPPPLVANSSSISSAPSPNLSVTLSDSEHLQD
jgi:hypothetical protein